MMNLPMHALLALKVIFLMVKVAKINVLMVKLGIKLVNVV